MSKFLEGVESHTPKQNQDAITKAKRHIQNVLLKAGLAADAKFGSDDITIKLEDGTLVVLEVKSAGNPDAEENFEVIDKMRQKKLDKFAKNAGNVDGTLNVANQLKASDPDPSRPSRGVQQINKEVDKLGKVVAKNIKRVAKMLK